MFTENLIESSTEYFASEDNANSPVVPTEKPAEKISAFAHFGLAPELLRAVADLGYTAPTEVQERAVPSALQGGDWMVSSQTGSGKTAAFLLPVLNTLLSQLQKQQAIQREAYKKLCEDAAARGEKPPKKPKRKNPVDPRNFRAATPGAIILCPTRELAQQVADDAIKLVQHCSGLRIATVVGGMPFGMQISKLQNANLVVATPGRLLDLQRRLQIKMDQVQFLVVDEADRMLDLGFADDLAEINQLTIKREQTMMFSATFAPRIMALASRVMRAPKRIEVHSAQTRHENIKQLLHWADNTAHKRKLLDHWLRDASIEQVLVFASTQIECDALAQELADDGFSAVALHGALNQALRNRRLNMLREGRIQILVATDVAARGIDVPSISHVINFGLPMKAEDYIHRIGRTGRAGRNGHAITLAEMRDRRKIGEIEHYSQQPLRATVIPGLEPTQKPTRGSGPRNSRDFGRPAPGGNFRGNGHSNGRSNGHSDRNSNGFSTERQFAPAHPAKRNARSNDANSFSQAPLAPRQNARPDHRGNAGFGGGFNAGNGAGFGAGDKPATRRANATGGFKPFAARKSGAPARGKAR